MNRNRNDESMGRTIMDLILIVCSAIFIVSGFAVDKGGWAFITFGILLFAAVLEGKR